MDRVNWVVRDCFNAAHQLRKASRGSTLSPHQIRARTHGLVQALLTDAAQAGFGSEDARLMAFAVVALLDEIARARPGPLQEHWSPSLQLEFFRENQAGKNFFVHLERIRHDPARTDVLRVFYLVLLFGFQGEHGVKGSNVALSDLIESLRTQLGRGLTVPEFLSPDAHELEPSFLPGMKRLPLPWLGAGAMALALVFYLGVRVSLKEQTEALLAWMQTHV